FNAEETDAAIQVNQMPRPGFDQARTNGFDQAREEEEIVLKKGIARNVPALGGNAQDDFNAAFWGWMSAHSRQFLDQRRLGNAEFFDIDDEAVVTANNPDIEALFELVPLAADHDSFAVGVGWGTRHDLGAQVRVETADFLEQIPNLFVLEGELGRIGKML